jgi:hypothetical protein
MTQVLNENQRLKVENQQLQGQMTQTLEAVTQLRNELKSMEQFKQILENPMDKFTVEMFDSELLRQIRGRMIETFGAGGQMDATGQWAQTIVNERLQIVLRQLLLQGMKHWHRVKPQVQEIIRTQGLMK